MRLIGSAVVWAAIALGACARPAPGQIACVYDSTPPAARAAIARMTSADGLHGREPDELLAAVRTCAGREGWNMERSARALAYATDRIELETLKGRLAEQGVEPQTIERAFAALTPHERDKVLETPRPRAAARMMTARLANAGARPSSATLPISLAALAARDRLYIASMRWDDP